MRTRLRLFLLVSSFLAPILLTGLSVSWLAAPAHASPFATAQAIAAQAMTAQASAITPTQIRYRRYLDEDVVIYRDRPSYGYYAPPRYAPTYGYAPPPPVFYREPAPIVEFLPPPRPASCGKFRYWNGDYCADARYRPPYIGPRW